MVSLVTVWYVNMNAITCRRAKNINLIPHLTKCETGTLLILNYHFQLENLFMMVKF